MTIVEDGPPKTSVTDRRRNLALMSSVPLILVLIGAYFWLTSGRYVSTENAYIKQDKVSIGPDIPGRIVEVLVDENQHVEAGTPLFRLDARPYEIALREAQAALESARISVQQLQADYLESLADLSNAEADLDYQKLEYDRQVPLVKKGVASQSKLDDVRHALQNAQDDVQKNREAVNSAKAALGTDVDGPVDQHPVVMEAKARLDKAQLDLSHVTVPAPAAGIVSRTALLQVGMYMVAGAPALSLVKDTPIWVEANFKETELTRMRPGQISTVRVDAFPDLRLTATVGSIGAGTGSEFSLLPAQNASGNWVKVVQRVPVRLKLDQMPQGGLLKTGMSVRVRVDTKSTSSAGAPDEQGAPMALRVGDRS